MIGHAHAELVQRLDDLRHRLRGSLRVDRDAHQFRAGLRQRHHLIHRGHHVRGVGIGHGLDHDRMVPTHRHIANPDRHRNPALLNCHSTSVNFHCSNERGLAARTRACARCPSTETRCASSLAPVVSTKTLDNRIHRRELLALVFLFVAATPPRCAQDPYGIIERLSQRDKRADRCADSLESRA